MAVFVHLCPAGDVRSIRRYGLKVQKGRRGVYAMPATPDFYRSHQWLRELRRWRPGPLAAIYVRLPDDTPILFGPYLGPHTEGTADQAVAVLMASREPLGFETTVLRNIAPREILRIKPMHPITGWRYYPAAKGRQPCGCPAYQARGEPFSRRFKQRFAAEEAATDRN